MGVVETRLGNVVDDHTININGYSTLRQNRTTEGGDVVLCTWSNPRAKILAQSDTESLSKPLKPEYLICKFWGDKIPYILVCIIYRPPKISFSDTSDFLDNLRDLCSSFSLKIIMGDFNADLLINSSNSQLIRSLADELSLQVINHKATNRPPGAIDPKTWIDMIFFNFNDSVLSFNNKLASFHTSHNLIDVEIEIFIPKP